MNHSFFPFDARLLESAAQAETAAAPAFAAIEEVAAYNQQKVLSAFIRHKVTESDFVATTGYGYGDRGRETLEKLYADIFGAEDALVRLSLLCGTHALAVGLFGVLRPGDTLLMATGAPYDTLQTVIGLTGNGKGSLRDWGIRYRQVDLDDRGLPDLAAVTRAVREDPSIRVVHIQRSRGYSMRPSLSVRQIGELIAAVKEVRPSLVTFVDNCYGEFVETYEPTQVGADLMAGSLIKNPGGGLAENGGYLCGRRDLIEQCSYQLTAPGIGREVGASLGHNRLFFMGLFEAPHVVGEALKTAAFSAALFSRMGYGVSPGATDPRADIIQVIRLGEPEKLIAFCRGLQSGAPVDAFVVPEPWDMPGYDSQVIMAAGTFTMGSSIELSADAPLRPPYAVFMQGGLNYPAAKIGVLKAAEALLQGEGSASHQNH